MGFSGQRTAVIMVTPVITAGAYTAGKQLGSATRIPSAVSASGTGATLMSVSVVDKANQKSAIDVLIFNAQPTLLSVDTGTFNISSAELASKYQGRLIIPNTNYKSNNATNADVLVANIWQKVRASASTLDLWCVLVCQGTPTFATTSDLVLTFGLDQD